MLQYFRPRCALDALRHATARRLVDPTAVGPLHLSTLRLRIAEGPPSRLVAAPVAVLAYPDWRRYTPAWLAKVGNEKLHPNGPSPPSRPQTGLNNCGQV